ncbi:SCO family protein [Halalkalirubrum salinum]|uniref:SCO family protein n=1 Tax=Halalkalirubrum salinum TaxID=2563889 RepID=UPI001F10C312|nr:SCO family protein [Halalkalirubrum salinum]
MGNHSRRSMLKRTGAAAIGLSIAGCTDAVPFISSGPDGVVLDPPENYDQIKDVELPYPIYGDELPEGTVQAPHADRTVTTTEFVGERHVMLTFIFTRCSMACPVLTANLRQVQAMTIEEDAADEFAFMPITFDPEYDTPERLREYGDDRGVNWEADNWWFLRPETEARAAVVVDETFGVFYEYVPEDERENDNMAWDHSNLIVLANADGYVERAYTGEPPNPADVVEDARTLRDRW